MKVDTFFQNFELLTDAPNAIDKLRKIILQLAVMGKLTPQNPNDELASILLKIIKTQKEQLIKDKKIPKDKPLPLVVDSELPYEVPERWQWVRLGELAKVIEYGTSEKSSELGGDIPVFRMNNIRDGKLLFDNLKYLSAKIKDLPRLFLQKNDLLFNRTNSYELVGKTGVFKGDSNQYTFASYLIRISLLSEYISPDFVNLALNSTYFRQTQIEPEITQQCGQANFNGTKLKNTLIPLPPLAEQKRIVEKCDRLLSICDEIEKRQQQKQESIVRMNESAIAQLLSSQNPDEFRQHWQRICNNFDLFYSIPETIPKLRQAILQLAVQGKLVRQDSNDEPASKLVKRIRTKKDILIKEKKIKKSSLLPSVELEEIPYSIPDNWVWVRLDDISDIGTGSTPLTSNREYYIDGNIPWITSTATSQEFINSADIFITESAVADYRLRIYQPGALIVALYGQGKTRGQISQLRIAATINQACAAIVFFEAAEDLQVYVKRVFEKKYDELRELSAGGAQPNLNVGKIKETLIPLPPLAEQKRIVAKVDRLMSLCDTLEAKLKQGRDSSEKLMEVAAKQVLTA
ncbi:restriction modification system DNA specificity domain protein [Tolypothrix tenuis PCC 7101]|uniref:Restriction modification system DNA specificity domain protein n=1 Tax=Tolypothrix tenuis PCC 7101 TaxID=231146 RepID=A0A1Z4N3C4_9CYAN|nr:restriction endonuclease subunit S [Aulosira sp. FACHB-113]BAZ00152.1 restriction modification system DNA specificity domain protein [Tolypothrix tenuis PCC 7101]BAZ75927.1 restriction modification system DNA specificity domain protein [Aulosira laxa NIES-50]